MYGDLIACARYRIDDEKERARHHAKSCVTHVLFLVNLPRKHNVELSNKSGGCVGFQGGSWTSAHIDDIRLPSDRELVLKQARQAPINELFYNMGFVRSYCRDTDSNFIEPMQLEETSVQDTSDVMLEESMETQNNYHPQEITDSLEESMELQQVTLTVLYLFIVS